LVRGATTVYARGAEVTPTPPIPIDLATEAMSYASDWDVLTFIVAILIVGVGGYLWVRRKEQEDDRHTRP